MNRSVRPGPNVSAPPVLRVLLIGEDRATRMLFEAACDRLEIALAARSEIGTDREAVFGWTACVAHVDFGRHRDARRLRDRLPADAAWCAATTADARPGTIEALHDGGFEHVFVKPIRLADIIAQLSRAGFDRRADI